MKDETLEQQIVAAFEKKGAFSEGDRERRAKTEQAARLLAEIGRAPAHAPSKQQRLLASFSSNVSRKTVVRDLRQLAKHFDGARFILANKLHEPHIAALGECGERVYRWRFDEPLQELAHLSEAIAGAADRVERGDWEWEKQFRAADQRPLAIAEIVIGNYEELIGGNANLPADVPGGCAGLKPLVREVYAILGIDADANHHVERALELRTVHRNTKPAEGRKRSA